MMNIVNMYLNNYTLQIVTLGCIILGCISSIVGTFAMLKKESLLGDSISHASLSGICLAFIIFNKKEIYILLLGALIIGLVCIALIQVIQNYSKTKFDSLVALILSTFFGLGLIILSYIKKIPGSKKSGLSKFIFGQASTLILNDIYIILIVSLVVLFILVLFWKEIKISLFDKDYAKSIGINSNIFRFLISFMIVINVIIGIQIAGVILITAMMILPAISARQWSNKLIVVIFLSSLFGIISSFFGSYFSSLDTSLPTGPLIVMVLSFFVIISFLFSPRGLLIKYYNIYKRNKEIKNRIGED